jgi:hypothetical protein
MRVCRGIEVQLLSFLTSVLDKDEQSTSRFSRFIHGKEHRYPLNRRLGGSQSRLVSFGKMSLSPAGIRTPNCKGRSLVIIPTELSQLPVKFVIKSLYYSLTPCSRVTLQKLIVSQLVKIFPAFYVTRRFITAFTSARHLSLS